MIQKNWQELIKPNKLEIVQGTIPERRASIVAEPLAECPGKAVVSARPMDELVHQGCVPVLRRAAAGRVRQRQRARHLRVLQQPVRERPHPRRRGPRGLRLGWAADHRRRHRPTECAQSSSNHRLADRLPSC